MERYRIQVWDQDDSRCNCETYYYDFPEGTLDDIVLLTMRGLLWSDGWNNATTVSVVEKVNKHGEPVLE